MIRSLEIKGAVHQEFLGKLRCSPHGWYETALPWKGDHPPYQTIKWKALSPTAFMRENTETIKCLRHSLFFFNECLETGPPVKKKYIWKVQVCRKFYAIALAGDIPRVFLQVLIREEDWDALWFRWVNSEHPEPVRILLFTRVLFCLGCVTFLSYWSSSASTQHMQGWDWAWVARGWLVNVGDQTVERVREF